MEGWNKNNAEVALSFGLSHCKMIRLRKHDQNIHWVCMSALSGPPVNLDIWIETPL